MKMGTIALIFCEVKLGIILEKRRAGRVQFRMIWEAAFDPVKSFREKASVGSVSIERKRHVDYGKMTYLR
jgi:hypothetical protein